MAVIAPLFITGDYPRHIMVMCGIWVISSMGLNLILGYVGQLNLAHGTFFGIGAYATALLIQDLGFSFWLALPLGCLITAILGFLTGLPTLRTQGHYFPIATMCLGISIYYVIARWDELTGGRQGLFGLPRPDPISLSPLRARFHLNPLWLATIWCFSLFSSPVVHLPLYPFSGGKTAGRHPGKRDPGPVRGNQHDAGQGRFFKHQHADRRSGRRALCRPTWAA